MRRNNFIKSLLGSSTLIAMDGFSSIAHLISNMERTVDNSPQFASFGAIHLNITNLDKSIQFYTKVVGMRMRIRTDSKAELGTESQTLLVIYQTAKTRFKRGFSGLYHFAIHAPNEVEFANMVKRVIDNKYVYSPVDHTMSKSIYLDDPDGINLEFTLETPERFKRLVTDRGLGIEDMHGNIRSASDYLDIKQVLRHVDTANLSATISSATYMGHIHLYANDVISSNTFYQNLGFQSFNFLPQFMFADLGAGGLYKHRIAMNSWHGNNKPLAPSANAGMRYFHIIFDTQARLDMAISKTREFTKEEDGYWLKDPTGNTIRLSQG